MDTNTNPSLIDRRLKNKSKSNLNLIYFFNSNMLFLACAIVFLTLTNSANYSESASAKESSSLPVGASLAGIHSSSSSSSSRGGGRINSGSDIKNSSNLNKTTAIHHKGKARMYSRSSSTSSKTAAAAATAASTAGPSSLDNLNATNKIGQAKQSWLSVASKVAHSAVSDSNHNMPVGGDDSKPTKYHYYPHNQHLYLLPECATQQVCSAVYLRLNYSQPLCACPNFHEPCSVSTRTDDLHTIPLVTGFHSQVLTLVKTCEPTYEVRPCKKPKDWSILALQNSRTGKAHYLVICRCPPPSFLEGPIAHSQPAYARVPGIRVFGMTCITSEAKRTGRKMNTLEYTTLNYPNITANEAESRSLKSPEFPWRKALSLIKSLGYGQTSQKS